MLKAKFLKALKIAAEGLGVYYPSCAVCFGDDDQLFSEYLGCENGSFFDVASLTKPLAGSNLVMVLDVLDERIADFLPEPTSDSERKREIKVSDILRHRAGFLAHYPLFEKFASTEPSAYTRQSIMSDAWNLPLTEERTTLYSDIGFISLTYYLEKRTNMTVDELFRSKFSFDGVSFLKDLSLSSRIVPTYYTRRVHDENAHYMLAVSLHAGLFCTPEGVASVIRFILENHRELFLKEGPKEVKAGNRFFLGFDSFVHQERLFFGHLGFTGCGFWIDFEHRTYAVFLSNRVFPSIGRSPSQAPEGFQSIRRRIWQILAED